MPTATIQRWFNQRRRAGLALGIVVAGIGVGALVFAPLINHLILSYGWRNAYLSVGLLCFTIMVVSAMVIRRSPEKPRTVSESAAEPKSTGARGWTAGRAVTSPSFIVITLVLCTAVMAIQTVFVHLVPHAIDVGISPSPFATAHQ